MAKVFLDTSYAIALAVRTDQHHQAASELTDILARDRTEIITTRAVLLEIGNSLAKRHRNLAIGILSRFELDQSINIQPLSEDLYRRSLRLFSSRLDKAWSLVDCISFVVMTDFEVTEAATADEHFEQAGFKALLREPPQG